MARLLLLAPNVLERDLVAHILRAGGYEILESNDIDDAALARTGACGLVLEEPPTPSPPSAEASLEAPARRIEYRLPEGGIDFADLEREVLTQALSMAHGNQTRAAALLNLTRDQMRYRMAKFGLFGPGATQSGTE